MFAANGTSSPDLIGLCEHSALSGVIPRRLIVEDLAPFIASGHPSFPIYDSKAAMEARD
jgi:hypothetical protein